MINHTHRCIFIHIPKTAGTSIENAIWGDDWTQRTEEQLWMGAVCPGYNKYQSGGLQHLLATQIRQEVGTDVFNDYYKFSITRNPWDKVVSQYLYVKTRRDIQKMMGLPRWLTFRAYVNALVEKHDLHVQSMEQFQFLYGAENQLLVDFVGRFDTLDADFQHIVSVLGLGPLSLPHAMQSQRKKKAYQHYYSSKTKQIIATLYRRDIDLFDYAF